MRIVFWLGSVLHLTWNSAPKYKMRRHYVYEVELKSHCKQTKIIGSGFFHRTVCAHHLLYMYIPFILPKMASMDALTALIFVIKIYHRERYFHIQMSNGCSLNFPKRIQTKRRQNTQLSEIRCRQLAAFSSLSATSLLKYLILTKRTMSNSCHHKIVCARVKSSLI